MVNTVGVEEAKKQLSEIMSRTAYNGDLFIIERHGKPMVALVSPQDLERLDGEPANPEGLLAAVGALSGFEEEIDEMVADIYRQREKAFDRPISFEN